MSNSTERPSLARVLGSLGVAAVVFWIGYEWLDPAPLSSATGIGLGLLGLWIGRAPGLRQAWTGLLLGLAIGVAGHARVHATGGSPHPDEGLFLHFGADFLRGGSVALPAIMLAWLVTARRTAAS
ncbi:MAG: hypothetical protein O2816_18055 [Planctomycetota bacterium]|nr:hypothetical protein [Planctomycetota bacterium]